MHTQLLHGALLVVFSPPASPAGSLSALHLLSAQRGLGLLRRPPHMTCGELFIIEGAPWGSCSLRAGPARLSPVSYLPLTLPPRTTEKSADGVTLPRWGRPLSLLLEALKSSQQTAPHPRPYKSSRPMVPTLITSWRCPREMDHAGHVVPFKFYHFGHYRVAVMHGPWGHRQRHKCYHRAQ